MSTQSEFSEGCVLWVVLLSKMNADLIALSG